MPSARTRLGLEVGFIILVAVGAGLAEVDVPLIVLLIGLAWLLAAFVEWTAWQESAGAGAPEGDVAVPTATDVLEAAGDLGEEEAVSQAVEPRDAAPEVHEPAAAVAATEDAPPQPPVEDTTPVAPSGNDGPREWNIWYLERILHERAGDDVLRNEERVALLRYLREFASADGLLPVAFDDLVRESFDELLGLPAGGGR